MCVAEVRSDRSERDFVFEARAKSAVFGGIRDSKQIPQFVLYFAATADLAQIIAASKHRADPKLLLVQLAGMIEVVNLAVDLNSGLEQSVQPIARLPSVLECIGY